ncbi:hypothetical protein ES703_107856 [subsurface metagenome]
MSAGSMHLGRFKDLPPGFYVVLQAVRSETYSLKPYDSSGINTFTVSAWRKLSSGTFLERAGLVSC